MIRPLENKRALVTGGSRGIGAAVVGRLARVDKEGTSVTPPIKLALTEISKAQANTTRPGDCCSEKR